MAETGHRDDPRSGPHELRIRFRDGQARVRRNGAARPGEGRGAPPAPQRHAGPTDPLGARNRQSPAVPGLIGHVALQDPASAGFFICSGPRRTPRASRSLSLLTDSIPGPMRFVRFLAVALMGAGFAVTGAAWAAIATAGSQPGGAG